MTLRLALLTCLFAACATAQDVSFPGKDKFQLFLLVGQSNMAGRGVVEEQDQTSHPRVLMLGKDGRWLPVTDPIHFDKPEVGVGLGKTFGRIIAEANPGVTIGLIPCVVGETPIGAWQPGVFYPPTKSHPWDDTVKRVEIALKAGTLKGILWHQGEGGLNSRVAEAYQAKLHDLVKRLRELVKLPDVPFIAGQMGQFGEAPWNAEKKLVDKAHQYLPKSVPHTAFVNSGGGNHKGDKIHFDAAAGRGLGQRYGAAYLKMTGE